MNDPIIDKCIGCANVVVGPEPGVGTCCRYMVPASKWRYGNCPMATHLEKVVVEDKMMDPLKQSKRNAKGR